MLRTRAVLVAGALVLAAAPVLAAALPAAAADGHRSGPTTVVATTTTLKATPVVGSPGKVVFGIHVVASSGPVPTGTVTLVVDSGTPVVLTLKANGRATYTHHYKPGLHTATATYPGSTGDLDSKASVQFTAS
jgi:spore coat protein U-like protein